MPVSAVLPVASASAVPRPPVGRHRALQQRRRRDRDHDREEQHHHRLKKKRERDKHTTARHDQRQMACGAPCRAWCVRCGVGCVGVWIWSAVVSATCRCVPPPSRTLVARGSPVSPLSLPPSSYLYKRSLLLARRFSVRLWRLWGSWIPLSSWRH